MAHQNSFKVLFVVSNLIVLKAQNCTMIPAGSTVNIIEPVTIGETVADHCIVSDGKASIYSCPPEGHIGTLKLYTGDDCAGDPDIYDVIVQGTCYSDYCFGYNDV